MRRFSSQGYVSRLHIYNKRSIRELERELAEIIQYSPATINSHIRRVVKRYTLQIQKFYPLVILSTRYKLTISFDFRSQFFVFFVCFG